MFIQVTDVSGRFHLINKNHIACMTDSRNYEGCTYMQLTIGEDLHVKHSLEEMGYKVECPIIPEDD